MAILSQMKHFPGKVERASLATLDTTEVLEEGTTGLAKICNGGEVLVEIIAST